MTKKNPLSRLTFLLATLAACGTDTNPSADGEALQCITRWDGDMAGYGKPSMTIRACLNADTCSDELEMVLPNGIIQSYPDFDLWAQMYETESTGPTLLGVQLWYLPRIAATLSPDDRPTLTVWDDAGDVLIDSVSQVPYETYYYDEHGNPSDPNDPRTETCKVVALNLDGSNRGFLSPAE